MQLLQEGSNRKRAVSGTAATSSLKKSRGRRAAPVATSDSDYHYQTRSKDQH
jgi:hypothetical protein